MEVAARLEGVQPYTIHGSPYLRAYFSHADDPETIHRAQLPAEAVADGLRPGDAITITYLLRTVMRIDRPAP
ncbi:MAG: hypothetical protein ACR2OO_02440 [Thermomicrobiales bacterium]